MKIPFFKNKKATAETSAVGKTGGQGHLRAVALHHFEESCEAAAGMACPRMAGFVAELEQHQPRSHEKKAFQPGD